jgi:3-hydroxyacyl-[acyl-carrier-protein] dehydratase
MNGTRDLPPIPHRAPWLLVDRVVEAGGERVVAEKRLTAADPLVEGVLPRLLLVEALAQAAACLRAAEAGQHRGMLVAVSGFSFTGEARPGDLLVLKARRIAALGALVRFETEALVDGQAIARGELTFAVG